LQASASLVLPWWSVCTRDKNQGNRLRGHRFHPRAPTWGWFSSR